MNTIEFNNVSKKFKKGENFDTLRDLIPHLIKTFLRGNGNDMELRDKEFWALKDVNFTVKRGEALGIIGSNGAGKSTILKLLNGILKPNSGGIKINGKLSALIEVGAGFHEDLTGRENIYLNGAIMGMKRREIVEKFDDIVSFAGLEEFIDTPVKRYSSGMYVRLGFSIAAHMDPEILLIDEVLAVGDYSFQNKCIQKINDILDSGATIIFVSHNLELVRRLCPNSIFLKKGRIIFRGDSAIAVEHYMKSVDDPYTATNSSMKNNEIIKRDTIAQITDLRLLDEAGIQQNEFKTGDYVTLEISYNADVQINKPSFAVGFISNGQLITGLHSNFEGYDIESIHGCGKISLVIPNILLLPGFYEARVHLADKDSLAFYYIRSVTFFVKEQKRAVGQYYQPHFWKE